MSKEKIESFKKSMRKSGVSYRQKMNELADLLYSEIEDVRGEINSNTNEEEEVPENVTIDNSRKEIEAWLRKRGIDDYSEYKNKTELMERVHEIQEIESENEDVDELAKSIEEKEKD